MATGRKHNAHSTWRWIPETFFARQAIAGAILAAQVLRTRHSGRIDPIENLAKLQQQADGDDDNGGKSRDASAH